MILYSMVAPFCNRYSSSNRTLAVDNFLQCWYSISERCPGDRSALTERCSGVKENVNTLNNIFWSSVQYCTKSLESCAGNNTIVELTAVVTWSFFSQGRLPLLMRLSMTMSAISSRLVADMSRITAIQQQIKILLYISRIRVHFFCIELNPNP